MDFEIVKIEPRWMHGYANAPDIEVTVTGMFPFKKEDWFYQADPVDVRADVMLVSTNNWPWCRFAYIGPEPQGNPTYHGNAGGEFYIANEDNDWSGEIFKSRTGWSSREGVVNTEYRHLIPDELAGVIVYNGDDKSTYRMGWHGYYIMADYLSNHEKWPADLYLVRTQRFSNDEIYHHISVDPYSVRKPEVFPNREDLPNNDPGDENG